MHHIAPPAKRKLLVVLFSYLLLQVLISCGSDQSPNELLTDVADQLGLPKEAISLMAPSGYYGYYGYSGYGGYGGYYGGYDYYDYYSGYGGYDGSPPPCDSYCEIQFQDANDNWIKRTTNCPSNYCASCSTTGVGTCRLESNL